MPLFWHEPLVQVPGSPTQAWPLAWHWPPTQQPPPLQTFPAQQGWPAPHAVEDPLSQHRDVADGRPGDLLDPEGELGRHLAVSDSKIETRLVGLPGDEEPHPLARVIGILDRRRDAHLQLVEVQDAVE